MQADVRLKDEHCRSPSILEHRPAPGPRRGGWCAVTYSAPMSAERALGEPSASAATEAVASQPVRWPRRASGAWGEWTRPIVGESVLGRRL